MRTTNAGKQVCTFTVAVNKRVNGQNEAEFFRVSAWEKLGENCAKYLDKGRKVAVHGSVSAQAYADKEGKPRASLEIMAREVEFLTASTPATVDGAEAAYIKQEREAIQQESGFVQVDEELPF